MTLATFLLIAKEILSFIITNWEFILLIPLIYKYIKTQAWGNLFNLAVKISTQIKTHNISNVEKHDTVKDSLVESPLSKLFDTDTIDKIVTMAYQTEVKDNNVIKLR